jgi:hypothetical protein
MTITRVATEVMPVAVLRRHDCSTIQERTAREALWEVGFNYMKDNGGCG